ncbi:hypothetical protein AK812_SmicGene37930 [Symbiodinium microadriaticum]|uniref:Uncharacterized protein n=1 Tax=Symbiodinium microadriaticum TaxID=2951 RepID=A0A1Q9CF38_SYMMI|nr:hypothetical protein AK812_SmicGene37930 [Symbiodinium microadriaticum]CAE7740428.1 unnamed protein product [Symbiodinium microadriaticum]
MVPARDNAGPSAPGQAAIPTPSSGLVHDLQELLNAARKTENRLSKLQNGRAKVAEKWQLYQQKLKDAWMKEHGRFLRDTERLDRDIQEAAQEQGRAFQAVRQAWTQASQGPSVPMETSAEGQWEQLRNGWEQEDGAQLQAILQRATGVPLPGPSMDQQRQLKPELVQLLAHFGAGAVANGFGGPPPGLSSTSSDVPMSVGPMVPPGFGGDLAAPSATAPTDPAMAFNPGASTSKLVGDASTSPHHPGQRDLGAGRTPTTEAPPRKDVKSATRTQPTVDTLQGPGLAEKLDKKREHASGAALRPFGLPGPTDHPPPPVPVHNLSSTTSQDKESDDELDSASPPGHPFILGAKHMHRSLWGMGQAIAEQIGSTVSQLCFQKDVSDIVLRPLDANFTFVDARRVGRGLRAFLRTTWSDASSILRCVNPKVPDGFSASLRTRACAGTAPDDIIWDWQEVRFRAVDCSPSGDNVEYLADANSHAEDSAGVDQTPVSHVAQGGADNAEGFYAAIATGQLNPAHLPSEGFENAPVKDKLWVLLFAPDRTPETVWISACPPLHWDDALAAVQAARDISHSSLYGHVCKVHPQPSAEFASLICLTNWAMHRTAVIFDGRAFDGRLYCLLIDPWIQWGSFLLQTGLPDNDSFVVVIKGVVHARGRPLVFSQGDMVQILEYGAAIPPVLDLDDLMFVGNSWEADPPLAFSSSFSHFWVLHEGGSRGIDADYHKIDSVYGFQEFAADVLQFAQFSSKDSTLMCPRTLFCTLQVESGPAAPLSIDALQTVVTLNLALVLTPAVMVKSQMHPVLHDLPHTGADLRAIVVTDETEAASEIILAPPLHLLELVLTLEL